MVLFLLKILVKVKIELEMVRIKTFVISPRIVAW